MMASIDFIDFQSGRDSSGDLSDSAESHAESGVIASRKTE